MSQLIKKLRHVSESIAPSLGFKPATTSPGRLMLLIAALPKNTTSQIIKITSTEVDAIVLHSQDLEGEAQNLSQIASSIGDTPWGVCPETMTGEGIRKLWNMGGDFLTFVASKAPAVLLGEEIGKVLKLSLPLDSGLIRTIDQLPIDAVLLDFREKGDPITVSQLMDCQRLAGSIRKPLMVAVQHKLDDKEIQALWEAGVNGLVVEAQEKSQSEFARLRQSIATLRQAPRKSRGQRVLLPHLEGEADESPEDLFQSVPFSKSP